MGAILFIAISVAVYVIKIIHNARNLTFDKWCEIFISFFIFTNCLNFGLTYFDLGNQYVDGTFSMQLRLEVYMIIAPIFFIVLSRRTQWHLLPLPWYVIFGLVLFSAINIFNPNNMAVASTVIALAQIILYLIFLYIVCSRFTYTVLLQTVLTLCYPVLGIYEVTQLFREGVSIRAEERPGAPGTFNHPNVLGGYISYVFTFFTACILYGYKRKQSIVYAILAFFVLFSFVFPVHGKLSFSFFLTSEYTSS